MEPQQHFHFSFPTSITYGTGSRKNVAETLKQHSCTKPMIVTDRDLAKLPLIGEFHSMLKSSGSSPQVFSGIWGNPVKSQVMAGVDFFRSTQSDAIVAIGGGAALDVAKVIALMIHHPGDLFDYEDGKPDAPPVDQPIPLIIAVPTTAGTGSEVGRASVISDDVSKAKKIIFSPRMLPSKVFVDPGLSLELPAHLTAATGLDALTHLIEAYLATGFHPMCDGIALEGIGLVAENLKPCFEFAKNPAANKAQLLVARGMMLNAAYMGAVAFQKGLGVNHSCAHALSTVCDLHHGLANGILLPFCMQFNVSGCESKFQKMAMAAGLSSHTADAFIQWLSQLKRELEIPEFLTAAGVEPQHIDALVKVALQDGCHQSNPRPVSESDFKDIFSKALGL